MESNEEMTRGDHPQVPPAKPPDHPSSKSDGFPPSENHVFHDAMSEDTSEEETPAKNGVSLPIKSASDPGGDHAGAANGCPGVISRDHVGTPDCGPEETVPPGTSNQGTGKTPKSRSLDNQEAKVTKKHFDKRMSELINATRDLAQEQHTDNLKIEAGVGVSTQIGQDMMQFLTEFEEKTTHTLKSFEEKVRVSQKDLRDKMVLMEDRLCATENSANDALALSMDVKTSINGMRSPTGGIHKSGWKT